MKCSAAAIESGEYKLALVHHNHQLNNRDFNRLVRTLVIRKKHNDVYIVVAKTHGNVLNRDGINTLLCHKAYDLIRMLITRRLITKRTIMTDGFIYRKLIKLPNDILESMIEMISDAVVHNKKINNYRYKNMYTYIFSECNNDIDYMMLVKINNMFDLKPLEKLRRICRIKIKKPVMRMLLTEDEFKPVIFKNQTSSWMISPDINTQVHVDYATMLCLAGGLRAYDAAIQFLTHISHIEEGLTDKYTIEIMNIFINVLSVSLFKRIMSMRQFERNQITSCWYFMERMILQPGVIEVIMQQQEIIRADIARWYCGKITPLFVVTKLRIIDLYRSYGVNMFEN